MGFWGVGFIKLWCIGICAQALGFEHVSYSQYCPEFNGLRDYIRDYGITMSLAKGPLIIRIWTVAQDETTIMQNHMEHEKDITV